MPSKPIAKKAYYEKHKRKFQEYERNRQYKKMYGITVEDYNKMFEAQRGLCAICGTNKPYNAKRFKHFCVDHCHASSKIRGLLCAKCNTMLGWYEANKEKILGYLK